MVRSTAPTADAPDPFPIQPQRFPVAFSLVIDRPHERVWEEYRQGDHPAWSDHPEGQGPTRRVGDVVGMAVGAAFVSVMAPNNRNGIRSIIHIEVKHVEPGHAVTTECIVTGAFEATETVRLLEHSNASTLVDLSSWVNTVPTTTDRAARLRYNLQRIQRGYLARAKAWSPGVPHRPNLIATEPEDLANLGYS